MYSTNAENVKNVISCNIFINLNGRSIGEGRHKVLYRVRYVLWSWGMRLPFK